MINDDSSAAAAVSNAGDAGAPQSAARPSVAEALIDAFAACGTRRMFGLPGGGSSLDLIEAARRRGIDFVLARHECAAVMMAAATAELDGSLGVALTTKGPGTANATNGVAHAALDRCPVAVVTDGFSPQQLAYVSHQWFDQRALFAPLVKAHSTLAGAGTGTELEQLAAAAFAPRRGPVHVELTGPDARAEAGGLASAAQLSAIRAGAPGAAGVDPGAAPEQTASGGPELERAAAMLAAARRPVLVLGLESRDEALAQAVRQLVDALGCAVLVTYKAKGVVADGSPQYVGIFTGGSAERAAVERSDLIVLVGLDPVELILQPWPYRVPVLEIGWVPHPVH
ncbi:MAG: thiamine pyrophosphate-binding protein, partial [Burkholderiales bacterium]